MPGASPASERAAREQGETGEQHRARAEAVDGEARGELVKPLATIEQASKRAERRVADAEFRAQQRKQRRQRQLEEMRQRVGERRRAR